MKRTIPAAFCLLALAAVARAQLDGRTIYGNDDRLDLYQVQNQSVLKLADSTVALFPGAGVTTSKDRAALKLFPYGQSEGLCKEEPFWDQKNGAFCSGSLVAPDIIMTAGHCVTSQADCKNVKFVFGFSIPKEGASPDSVPAGEVYSCKKLLGREQIGTGADWALVKLNHKVKKHKPLRLNTSGKIANGTPLFVIGHPAGLPTKVAGGAKVRDDSPNGYFVANLDTYGGNSGSAVFNAATGLVEGILVRGEVDFVQKGDCRVSNRCPDDGCRGEDVTRIANVLPRLPHMEQATQRLAPIAANIQQILDRQSAAALFDGGGR